MIWAWLGAAAVGISLGLLGSGGAILTVPILVYLVGHDEKSAIAESLAIVGTIALIGAARAAGQGRVDFRSAALLAIPGVFGTYLGASAAQFIPGGVQLLLLAALMLTASRLMFRGASASTAEVGVMAPKPSDRSGPAATGIIAAQGVGLGLVTGLVGVGGGFLIVPVLVLIRRVPMPTAIGTSLAIIAVNSSIGLLKYLRVLQGGADAGLSGPRVDWSIVLVFSAVGIAGSLVGNLVSGRIDPRTLRRMFAVFLVVMAGYIVVRQAPRVFPGLFGARAAQSTRELEPRSGGVAPNEDNPADHGSPPRASTRGIKEYSMSAVTTNGQPKTAACGISGRAKPAEAKGGPTNAEVAPMDAHLWLRSGEAVLIDVREQDEHARERIPGAKLLPLSRFDPSQLREFAGPGRKIVLHCRSGRRSADAQRMAAPLTESGATVLSMAGGIEAWKREALPVEVNTRVSGVSVMRQVQMVIGIGVLAGSALAWFVNPAFIAIPAFFGAGLTFAGATGTCALATLIGKMPWNRSRHSGSSCSTGSCVP